MNSAILMPPRKFQTTFMPIPRKGTRAYETRPTPKSFDAIAGLTSEKAISAAWVETLNGTGAGDELCPGYNIALSQDRWDVGDEAKLKIDGALFRRDATPRDGRPHWPVQRALFEFKGGEPDSETDSKDPFEDLFDDYQSNGKEAFDQLASYVAHACNHQQRTALYAFLVNRRKIRVTWWDKSGIIVTPAFDYVDKPELLCDFLWGFSLLSDEKQGLDPTATLITPKDPEYAEMTRAAKALKSDLSDDEGTIVDFDESDDQPYVFKFQRKMFAESLDPNWPRYKLRVPGDNGPQEFLVCKPCFVAKGVLGRGTRGYAALDSTTKRLVFLKDTWRPSYDGVEQEGSTIEKLFKAKVPNIPTLVCHGDLGQKTLSPAHYIAPKGRRPQTRSTRRAENGAQAAAPTQPANEVPQGTKRTRGIALARAKEALSRTSEPDDCPLRKLTHYRMVVAEICMPLCDFKSGKELISIVNDCILAHWKAVESTHRMLHRDVSTGNILILPRVVIDEVSGKRLVLRKGVLTDWELAKTLPDEGEEEVMRQPSRTGTWQFISVFALDFPEEPLRPADDLESFFYVILYNIMRYLDTNINDIPFYMSRFFDSFSVVDGTYGCGDTKRGAMLTGRIVPNLRCQLVVGNEDNAAPHPLMALIEDMLSWFQARYLLMAADSASKKASSLNPDVVLDEYEQERKKKKEAQAEGRRDALKELESNITSHGEVWMLLSYALRRSWPADDKVGDRLVDDLDRDDATSDAVRPAKRAKRTKKKEPETPTKSSQAAPRAVPPKAIAPRGGRGLANRRPLGRAKSYKR